ncbi:MAG: amidophosphoribosyltransferase [Fusicatenibacter sp.]|nr:amidophosphoribosyltransferase [Fusicatenibacter sp.]
MINSMLSCNSSSACRTCSHTCQNGYETGLREECGVFGIYDLDGNDVSPSIYYGLSALQHRGQESCGIAVSDTEGPKGHVSFYKGLGLVNEVFKESKLSELSGNIGIGHVRYSTTGSTTVENAQPLVLNYLKGSLTLAHNGNLVNAMELRSQMENTGAIFHTSIDSEIIAYGIARKRIHSKTVEDAILETVKEIRGAYALVIMSPRKLIGVRDPFGLKPLCIGKRNNAWVLASESCALSSIGAEFVRDVKPGEIVTFDKTGAMKSEFMPIDVTAAHCIFEYIYFARLDSTLDGISVYDARIRGGASLAKTYPVDADLVVGVPDSGLAAAKGFSEESGIPFGIAFHKNSYIGRTFIKPSQKERESSVKIKLSVLESVVKGKRIVLVDDSIVRGTTITNLITMIKNAGATEVHVRISSPPFLHPCYFGTDVPSNKQLIAHTHSTEEIRKKIGADSLGYMPIDQLQNMVDDLPICKACFDSKYPMEVPNHDISELLEN